MTATDYSKHKRVVLIEQGRIRGELVVLMGQKAWVSPLDMTIWDEGRHAGRVIYSNGFTASVTDGVCELPEHMIRSDVRDEVLDVLDEMKAACVEAVKCLAMQEGADQ